MHGCLRWLLAVALFLGLHSPLTAGVDLTTSASIALPIGELSDYSFGSTGVGATLQASTNLTSYAKVFVQGRILDFGLNRGYIPRDNIYSDSNIESVTDSYILSFNPGIALGKNLGGFIPYIELMGGVARHATISRINSREMAEVVEYSETSNVSWQSGAGLGVRTIMWEQANRGSRHFLDYLAFDLRVEYLKGGKIEYLNTRTTRFKAGELLFENKTVSGNFTTLNVGITARF